MSYFLRVFSLTFQIVSDKFEIIKPIKILGI